MYRTSFVDAVPLAEYPHMLEMYSLPRAGGFAYSNLGYLVYAAALEVRTGRDYRAWLDANVFRPLGMMHTFTRTSRARMADLAYGHVWSVRGWKTIDPKPDALMNAAGGVVTTPRDMARWLQAQIGVHRSAFPGAAFTEAQSPVPIAARAGIAILANADTATFELTSALMREFFDALTGKTPSRTASQFAAQYERNLQQTHEREALAIQRVRAANIWHGWMWKPTAQELAPYAGRYVSDRLGTMDVRVEDGMLRAHLGFTIFDLEPAAAGLFGATSSDDLLPMPFAFRSGASGRPSALLWGSREFDRR